MQEVLEALCHIAVPAPRPEKSLAVTATSRALGSQLPRMGLSIGFISTSVDCFGYEMREVRISLWGSGVRWSVEEAREP
jgi:hypothetical protein